MTRTEGDGHDAGAAAARWWRTHLAADTGAAKALRARLKRAVAPSEVLAHGPVIALAQELGLRDPHKIALIARALATVGESHGQRLARRFGSGDPKPLSELRFQRLIRAKTPEDLVTPLLRALAIVDGKCNVAALGADLMHWGDAVRARWCFDYFGASTPQALAAVQAADEETAE
jgi:CRISPR system Cascade subunit CasB